MLIDSNNLFIFHHTIGVELLIALFRKKHFSFVITLLLIKFFF
jgi:hypothetical protein